MFIARRSFETKNQGIDKRKAQAFAAYFQNTHLNRLNLSHLNILLKRETQFVGTRTLSLSVKFLSTAMTLKNTRECIKPYIETILFKISLPLFVATQKDILTFQQDPVEYVRMQVDHNNELNVKSQLSKFVQKLCSLKFGRRGDKSQSMHLTNYLQTIGQNL